MKIFVFKINKNNFFTKAFGKLFGGMLETASIEFKFNDINWDVGIELTREVSVLNFKKFWIVDESLALAIWPEIKLFVNGFMFPRSIFGNAVKRSAGTAFLRIDSGRPLANEATVVIFVEAGRLTANDLANTGFIWIPDEPRAWATEMAFVAFVPSKATSFDDNKEIWSKY